MKTHPAILMLRVWAVCFAMFFLLPFKMETRNLSVHGFLILGLFIGTFCLGAYLRARGVPQRPLPVTVALDFKIADRVMFAGAVVAILAFGYELWNGAFLDLSDAFAIRNDRATALLTGDVSQSSVFFQIGFLFYPVGFAYIVRELGFRSRPDFRKLAIFGIGPVLMASLAMGGRSPLLYAIIVVFLTFGMKRQLVAASGNLETRRTRNGRSTIGLKIAVGMLVLMALNYFVKVFLVRAETAGGVSAMFDIAATVWGVSFEGPMADFFMSTLGEGNTYLLFVFAWYLVQGIVMSNVLFSEYDGPLQLGIYGIDLAAAVMRRLDGNFVAERFLALLDLNTYGFLPSAFGSIYVDLAFFGLGGILLWGYLAGMVYKRTRDGADPRWFMVVPFVNMGIFFSVINTPIGFSNGLMIHIWLVAAFLTTRTITRPVLMPSQAEHQQTQPA